MESDVTMKFSVASNGRRVLDRFKIFFLIQFFVYLLVADATGFPHAIKISIVQVIVLLLINFISLFSERDGQLVIDESDPDKDVYSAVLYYDISELAKKHAVSFDVVRDKSQEKHRL